MTRFRAFIRVPLTALGACLWISAFLSPPPVAAQSGDISGDLLTPHHIANLRSVLEVEMSPDGKRVAYVVSVPRKLMEEDDGEAWRELHVLDVSSGSARPYVSGQVTVSKVAWSKDGLTLTYLAKREGDEFRSLYAIPVRGGESRKLLEHHSKITEYSLRADGKRVVFLSKDPKPETVEKNEELGFKVEIYEEADRFVRAWVASIDLQSLQPAGDPVQVAIEGNVSSLSWSPRGEDLLVAISPTPLIDDHYMQRRLHVVHAVSGKVRGRIENPGKLGATAWSPDGRNVAIVSGEDIHDPREGRLMVASADGGAMKNLLPDYMGHVAYVKWLDDQTIVYVGDEGTHTTVATVRMDGSGHRTLLPAEGPILRSLSVDAQGKTLAFRGDTPAHPSEVFVMDVGASSATRLSNNNPWLDRMRLGKQETIRYAARDGLEIEGVLIRPLDEQPGKRYPLVVQVHGGPEAHRRNGWLTAYSRPGQMAAARGMAVFYPNYRASTGRGVEFSKMDHEDTGGSEFDDIVDGVDYLIDTGLVDAKKVGVTGGSYGGYATAWLTTRYSDRFAAGVMFVGISNQISKVGTSDIANEMFLVHQRLRPWDDWNFFLERSPIYHAGKGQTPLLILHGKKDKRVNYGQSMELYRHLKLRTETPVRLVLYPDEKHGNSKAASRFDYNLRQLRWMEHYLKGSDAEMPPHQLEYEVDMEDAEKAYLEINSSRR